MEWVFPARDQDEGLERQAACFGAAEVDSNFLGCDKGTLKPSLVCLLPAHYPPGRCERAVPGAFVVGLDLLGGQGVCERVYVCVRV